MARSRTPAARGILGSTVRWLLDALRKMSATTSAELHSFADTLRGICDELADSKRFDPAAQGIVVGRGQQRVGPVALVEHHAQHVDVLAVAAAGRRPRAGVQDELAVDDERLARVVQRDPQRPPRRQR